MNMLDHESIDAMSDEERGELLVWLEALEKYVRAKLGLPDPSLVEKSLADERESQVEHSDPVGDIIIEDHKLKQLKAGQVRRTSGWMTGANGSAIGKVDDKHV